jgi:hypothetical protein
MNSFLNLSSGICSTSDVFRLPELRIWPLFILNEDDAETKAESLLCILYLNPAWLLLVTHRELIRRHQLWIIVTNAQF